MKALVLDSPGELNYRDVQLPPLEAHQVKIAVKATLVCGSDKKVINAPRQTPVIPGHELSGEVIEIAEGVEPELLGKRATVFPMFSCLKCDACLNEKHRDCLDRKSLGFDLNGSFAEQVIVDSRFIIPLPENMPYEHGALVEHLACAHNIAKDFINRNISSEADIVIIGDGPLALANIIMLKQHGFNAIHLIGKHENKLTFAKELGAKSVIHHEQINSFPEANIIIYSAQAKETLNDVLNKANDNAIVYPQVRLAKKIEQGVMQEKVMTLARAFAYDFSDFDTVIKLITDKKIPVDKLISRKLSLDEVGIEGLFDNTYDYKLMLKP